ncbi:DUF2332 domain-containing protein [Sphingomonas mesophila]|uniref:DUF2332 domain-containing protein n=1 Tax=Sphingomonas mesophila TaxID=2303576 RepID=UPI000E593D2B|nr:DUF2332 domain-containing protein [Sphingomonas mesophila]
MTTARERSALPPATELEYLARVYRRFADEEARGRPPLYVHLAGAVAGDEQVLARIATLPKPKQQPNLLFAAVRSLFGTPPDFPSFRADLIAGWPRLAEIILARSTQTNEPARCATLLPILSALPGPLALIEVGAAAGLCLLPDLYAYNYGGTTIAPERSDPARPTFTCTLSGPAAVPTRLPKIAWRAGLDLDPINLDDQARVDWLENLIWPGQPDRVTNFRRAVAVARTSRPLVTRGDLTHDLEQLCAQAPAGCTRVIFHSAVLAYVASQRERDAFAEAAMTLADVWISNESPNVFPNIAAMAEGQANGRFLLSVNARPLAWTDPHGASADWFGIA